MIEIEIKSLKIPMFLGIYEHEKTLQRDVIFDLNLKCNLELSNENNISHTLDYDFLITHITNHFKYKNFNLIEDVVYTTISLIKTFTIIQSGKIKITKTGTHSNVASVSIAFTF